MIKKIKFAESNFFIDDDNYENFWNITKTWERDISKFINKNFREDCIFIDIGAWIGPYTLLASSLNMKVYAFEPDPIAFNSLKKNVELNKFKYQPILYNYGLSKEDKKTILYSNSKEFGNSESSLIGYKNEENLKKTEIKTKNFNEELDEIKKNNQDLKIAMMKIDIEGGEFFIEEDIYNFVKKNDIFCILSYHHLVFNSNKLIKFLRKLKTKYLQLFVKKIYPSKRLFKIAEIFSS